MARRQSRQPTARRTDGPARVEQRCDRRIRRAGGWQLHHGGPSFRQCLAGSDRIDRGRSAGKRGRKRASQHPGDRRSHRPCSREGQAGVRLEVPRLPLDRRRDKLGPDLYGVTKRRTDSWLAKWLKSPEQMLQSDADAKSMLDKYKLPMPNQNLSDPEIAEYASYFHWADTNLRPQGKEQPQPAAAGTA